MKPLDAARSRALSILVIVACLVLGTITAVRRTSDMWYYFVAVFYGIAAINIAGEILVWKRASNLKRQRRKSEEDQSTSDDKDDSSPSS